MNEGIIFKKSGGGDITFGPPKVCFGGPKVISPPPPDFFKNNPFIHSIELCL